MRGIQTTWQELHANGHDDPPGVVPIPKRESPTEYAKVFSNDRTRCWEEFVRTQTAAANQHPSKNCTAVIGRAKMSQFVGHSVELQAYNHTLFVEGFIITHLCEE